MNDVEFRRRVQAFFPVPFEQSLVRESVPSILNEALRKTFTAVEKVKSLELSGPTTLQDAEVVVRVVPSASSSQNISVFDFMKTDMVMKSHPFQQTRGQIEFVFTPDKRLIYEHSGTV